ncbi:MAG: hypothetical protein K0R67_3605 [Paenibacillus sp.]|nr:hypothetical protein [Paenibacillus sp.]
MLYQGVQLEAEPRDLDLYTDRSGIDMLHEMLGPYATDTPVDSETGIYRSLLSHYSICGITVELVGSLEVTRESACYVVEVADFMFAYAQELQLGNVQVRIMPLVHELVFNVLRDRPDRYRAIAEAVNYDITIHREVWRKLLERNRIGQPFIGIIQELLPDLIQEDQA